MELVTLPVLALPQRTEQCAVETDSYGIQVRCVLLQQYGNKILKPIGYWSWSLCDAKTRFCATFKKVLAIVSALLQLRLHLRGIWLVVRAGHLFICWIPDLVTSTGQLARRRVCSMKFGFEVVHLAGIHHQAVNSTSSFPKVFLWQKKESSLGIRDDMLLNCFL